MINMDFNFGPAWGSARGGHHLAAVFQPTILKDRVRIWPLKKVFEIFLFINMEFLAEILWVKKYKYSCPIKIHIMHPHPPPPQK